MRHQNEFSSSRSYTDAKNLHLLRTSTNSLLAGRDTIMSDEFNNEPQFVVEERGKYQPRMRPNRPGKLFWGRTLLIGFAFFACSLAWGYYNFAMPLILDDFFEELGIGAISDFLIGVVMVLDNVVAIIFLPIFGALSDRTRSKWGKRTPYILFGSTIAMVAFAGIGIISGYTGIAVFWGMISLIMIFNFAMSFFRSPAVTLMPDLTDPKVRSTGNAMINLHGALAMVLGLGIRSISGMIFGEEAARSGGFYLVGIITMVGVLILFLTIKETPTGDKIMRFSKHNIATDPVTLEYIGETKVEERESMLRNITTIYRDKDRSGIWMLLVIFLWFFGFNALNTFYSLYATEYLGWEEGNAGLALMIAPATMVLTAAFTGKIAEWIGRKRTIFIGLIGLTGCLIALIFIKTDSLMILASVFGVIGIFYGMININTIVIIWELAPKGKVGTYTGSYYFFSQLSDTLTPLVAGGVFSLYLVIFNVNPVYGWQYALLMPYAIICEILAMICLTQVKSGESKDFGKKRKNVQEI